MAAKRWLDAKWWIAITITAAFGILSLLYPLLTRETKALTVGIQPSVPLVTAVRPPSPRIALLVGEKQVMQAYTQVITVTNTGTLPIDARDFHRPLTIKFVDGSILSARVAGANPSDLEPSIEVSSSRSDVVLRPLLMNSNDSFRIEILATVLAPSSVTARINGVRHISFSDDTHDTMPFEIYRAVVGFLIATVGLVAYFEWAVRLIFRKSAAARKGELFAVGVLCMLAGTFLMSGAIYEYQITHHVVFPIFWRVGLLLIFGLTMFSIFRITRPKQAALSTSVGDTIVSLEPPSHQ